MKKIEIADLISFLKDNLLTILTLVGVIIGIVLGVSIKETSEKPWTAREAMYLSFIGDLFLNLLRSLIIPLIIPSLIAAIGGLDQSTISGKVGQRVIMFLMITSVGAVVAGVLILVKVKPGMWGAVVDENEKRNVTTPDTLMDVLRNCFPPNLVGATMFQTRTSLTYPGESKEDENTGAYINVTDKNTWLFEEKWQDNPNILGLVVMSVIMGVAISAAGEEGRVLLQIFQSISNVMIKVTSCVIYFAPIGFVSLVAGQIVGKKNTKLEDLHSLGVYFGAVLAGLIIHAFLLMPTAYIIICKRLPPRYLSKVTKEMWKNMRNPATKEILPITIKDLEDNNELIINIGAWVNITRVPIEILAMFASGIYPKEYSISQAAGVALTATAASIGAAGIPQAGLVTNVMVLQVVGLPSDSIALMLSVDYLLDKFRTIINVLGDSIGAAIVDHLDEKDRERERVRCFEELPFSS